MKTIGVLGYRVEALATAIQIGIPAVPGYTYKGTKIERGREEEGGGMLQRVPGGERGEGERRE